MKWGKLREEMNHLDKCVSSSIRGVMMCIQIYEDEMPELYKALMEFDDPYDIPNAISEDALKRYWKIAIAEVCGGSAEYVSVEDFELMSVERDERCVTLWQWLEVA